MKPHPVPLLSSTTSTLMCAYHLFFTGSYIISILPLFAPGFVSHLSLPVKGTSTFQYPRWITLLSASTR
jgi:hypothetical protein